MHLGCIRATGAGSYRSLPVSLRPRHWSNTSAISLDLFFFYSSFIAPSFRHLLYSHCLFCSLPYINEATTPFSIRICILIYPWLVLGEQSEGSLISFLWLAICRSSLLHRWGTDLLWCACMQDIFTVQQTLPFTSTRAGPAWLRRTLANALLGPFRAFTRTFTFRNGSHRDRRNWKISAT